MDRTGAVAAIDCGTNSTRLLIVDGEGKTLERSMQITRLGAGVDATGILAPESIDRCLSVLREYRQVMDRFAVTKGRLAATSAARDASNGEEFLRAAGEVSGIQPELLVGAEEGRLSMAGALSDLDHGKGPFLVLDIGGGSTELVAGSGPDDPELSVVSLQVGCVRITERFLHSDPPTPTELSDAEAMIDGLLERAIADHPRFLAAERLVGLAGTVTTLASLHLGLDTYDRNRIHHAVLSVGDVHDWYRALASEVMVARLDRAGMVSGREDVIVGGALILAAVMTRFGFAECLVSEADILDGMAAGLLEGRSPLPGQ
jgi:exopolyphosphatase/guanosine-5'-triphosphate,3'-diphosphate pyrophosphatase